ncbi:MAG TPA: transcription-repair coupling factor [Thermoflexales bacterium]|nr:transcription-repair coupling factor [Thermoflexales bacterium]HQX09206.1 transcription-repair coupling factor [Thermoflexales bacterium]
MSMRPLSAWLEGLPEYQALRNSLSEPSSGPIALAVARSIRPLIVAALWQQTRRPTLYVTSSVEASRQAADAVRTLCGIDIAESLSLIRLVEPNTSFYDSVAPVIDVVTQRTAALARLSPMTRGIGVPPLIVASPRAAMHPTMAPGLFSSGTRFIRRDMDLALESMLAHWVSIGYENAPVVDRVGLISRRGGIIDVWSPVYEQPARIELFGDQVESIRWFDPGTQRSGETGDRIAITPLDLAAPSKAPSLVFDYLGEDGLIIIDDEVELRAAWEELENKAERERAILEDAGEVAQVKARLLPFGSWKMFSEGKPAIPRLVLGLAAERSVSAPETLANAFKAAPHFAGQLQPVLDYLKANVTNPVIVVSRQASRLAGLWAETRPGTAAHSDLESVPERGVMFVNGALPGGFIHASGMTLLTDVEIFGYARPDAFTAGRARRAAPEKGFADWKTGDAVVHEDYGVGVFRGTVKLTVNTGTSVEPVEGEREYLLLEYAEGDRLFVPLHHLDRVARYVGGEDLQPTLTKLHSPEWQTSKSKAKGAAADVARELLKLYAEREVAPGFGFSPDGHWQRELESSFAYVETDDQLSAILAVKNDMESPRPMDRLVCGDVGFGKTEVALRAAFKAVQDGKQVAVLVPTTVLAQQHHSTFRRRLAPFPVKIDMLSRFRTAAEKKRVIERMGAGELDIVIGTHGLIADRAQFKDLGLLVIDEEQRFGLSAKEKLKQLKVGVDVLTMTATPIPRTLHMGLSGVREISLIETPPAERLPIISYVGAFEDAVLQQAIQRELDRDGQVFVVHNRITTLPLLAQKVHRLVPEASIAIAHGQMHDRELSRIMQTFSDGGTNILVSTNIIESGLDIPNANTIIIDRADHFGLAELYQLRGRVGRSSTQAYAYFFHDRRAKLTEDAKERLNTLREAAGIGAGYMIAMRDLELRGAGDLLGPKQSGHVSSVGLDLYTRLLSHEVGTLRALRDGTEVPAEPTRPMVIDLPLAVGLPEKYVGDNALRLQLYRRMASLGDEAAVVAFEEELVDRFGKLPGPALNLTYQARLKIAASEFGAQSITTDGNRITIRADAIEKIPRIRLERLLGEDGIIGRRQVTYSRRGTPEQWKARLMEVAHALAGMVGR